MTAIQKSFVLVMALLLAAFALPGNAATKQFSFSASQTGATSWQLTYTNGTQGGGNNSNINSIEFTAPVDVSGVAILPPYPTSNTAYLCDGVAVAGSFSCKAGHVVGITFINGIPPNGGSAFVNVSTATAPTYTQDSCTSGLSWSAEAFTGNALGGTNFQPLVATATSTVSCVLQFLTQPANAQQALDPNDPQFNTTSTNITSIANTPNGTPVKVQALVGGAVAAWFNGSVTVKPNVVPPTTGTPTISGAIATASSGTATFGDPTPGSSNALTLKPIGTYTLTAQASGFTDATSTPFTIYDGVLNCGQPLASSFTNPTYIAPDQPGYATGQRNGYNKDGVKEQCVPVLYTFTNTILTDDTVHLSWDTQSQPNAAFMYSMNWRPRSVEKTNPNSLNPSPIGWPTTPRPQVAWLNTDGSDASIPGTPKYVPGLACLSGNLPSPYGTLSAAVAAGDSTITVTGIAANSAQYTAPPAGFPAIPAFPFPVVIANMSNSGQSLVTERMTVTGYATDANNVPLISPQPSSSFSGTYTITFKVTRGGDLNGGSSAAPHDVGYRVMSTPLPIIPDDTTTFPAPYKVKTQAHMCIAEHGFDGFNMTIDPNTGLPVAQVMYFTTVFDIGDGWVLNR